MTAATPVLDVSGLTVAYGGNQALSVESLQVCSGELIGVIGANGAGKSTLVNGLLDWSRGAARVTGTVRLDGRDVSALRTHERVQAGLLLVPEGKLIFGSLTVEANLLSIPMVASTSERRSYAMEEIYDLFPSLHARRLSLGSQLSGGERQMLGIARALRSGPRALLLDEPSIGLAPLLIAKMLKTIRMLADNGLTVLVVEQNVRAAIEVVDRVVLLERGRIVAAGAAADMRDDPRIVEAYLGTSKK